MSNADDDDKLWRYPKDADKLETWEEGVDISVIKTPAAWDTYDVQIQTVIAAYTNHLNGTPGFVPLDWQKVKAMLWVETGADLLKDWKRNPMQIGNPGDKGLHDLLTSPHGKIILPKAYATVLNLANVPNDGKLSIEAGIGYLLRRLANFNLVPVEIKAPLPPVPPSSTKTPPDAHRHPGAHHHQAAHKSSAKKHPVPTSLKITSWKAFTFPWVASTYNNHGDGNYADKLQYAYDIITGKHIPQLPQKSVDNKKKSVHHKHHKKI